MAQATQTQTAISDAANNFLAQAATLQVPRGTISRFLKAGYLPQPKQLQFHAKARRADFAEQPLEIGFGGARGGGKTACVFAQIAVDDCQRFENLKVLFLRESAGSATESVNDLRLKFLKNVEHKPTRNILTFPNNSRIILGHFQYEKDINKYLGLEYDIIVLEEATQLSGTKIKDIRTCNRSSKGFRPRMYLTTNPGGIGHSWFKKEFIEPYRKGEETDKSFVFSLESDNKYNNAEYRSKLEQLTGWKRKAWLEGDWDILAGQFFDNFKYDRHVFDFDNLPQNSEFWCALDYGFTHFTAVYLLAKYDGKYFVIDRHRARKMLPPFHCEEIKNMLARHNLDFHNLQAFVAGHDCFQQKASETGATIADQYANEGIFLTRANTDRVAGAGFILKLLGDEENKIESRLTIHPRCAELIEQLQILQHNPTRPEDVLKIDSDDDGNGGDDDYDSLRYGLALNFSKGAFL